MTGLPDFNYAAFHEAARDLRARGLVVVNPAENFGGCQTLPYLVYLREAIRQVVDCDVVVLLPGWAKSKGARLERHVAMELGIDVVPYLPVVVT